MVKWLAYKRHYTKKQNTITAITESWLKINETYSGELPPEDKIKVFIGDTFTTLSSEDKYYYTVNLPNKEKKYLKQEIQLLQESRVLNMQLIMVIYLIHLKAPKYLIHFLIIPIQI